MNLFFITGLPRSRSVWLSNLLTYGPAFCHHDALKSGARVTTVMEVLSSTTGQYEFMGDADSGLTFLSAELFEKFPNARWVFIERDVESAKASYRKYFDGRDPYVPAGTDLDAVFARLAAQYLIARELIPEKLVVRFDDLNQLSTVRAIWEWCVPGKPFNAARAAMLDTFEMNVLPHKIRMEP